MVVAAPLLSQVLNYTSNTWKALCVISVTWRHHANPRTGYPLQYLMIFVDDWDTSTNRSRKQPRCSECLTSVLSLSQNQNTTTPTRFLIDYWTRPYKILDCLCSTFHRCLFNPRLHIHTTIWDHRYNWHWNHHEARHLPISADFRHGPRSPSCHIEYWGNVKEVLRDLSMLIRLNSAMPRQMYSLSWVPR